MDTLKTMSVAKKKRTFKNIYCSTCEEWVSEYYLSCHLNSVFHERRFQKQTSKKILYKQKNQGQNKKQKKGQKTLLNDYETPDQDSDCYIIEGSTLKKAADIKSNKIVSPDLFSQARQRLFEKGHVSENETELGSGNEKAKIWSENQLDNSYYDGMLPWDFSDSNSSMKSVSLLANDTRHDENGTQNFPLNLLSGTFPKSPCEEDHLNQLSFYRCARCNPETYKDYEDC